jgi:hypothetical protein
MPNDSTDRDTLARGLPISPPDDDDTLTDDEVTNERLERPGDFGLCHGCAREGIEEPAQEGHDLCEECEFGAPCVACRGFGSADGRPFSTSTYMALVEQAERGLCPRCSGTGCERDAASVRVAS